LKKKIVVKNKSTRNIEDNKQSLGNACTDSAGRLMAALGKGSAETVFSSATDLSNGGLLLALPALAANGLFESLDSFEFDEKYYRIQDIFMAISFMVLSRIETINRLNSISPGEWGCLIGIDRIPEIKTLREKTDEISSSGNGDNLDNWIAERSEQWIQPEEGETVGNFYLDGHVRTYFGKEKLPYRYVARQKLCMRGLTDYWVNDAVGNPFFSVTSPQTHGLIAVLKKDIIPQLIKLVPKQSEEDIANDIPLFTIIFDREGYSMILFKELWDTHRIACQTYRKFKVKPWAESEFETHKEKTVFGTTVELQVAEKIISPIKDFELRDVRFLAEDGHQVSILTRDYRPGTHAVITHMKSRLSQENFFRYGRQEYNLDTLASYKKVDIDDTERVVNPKFRCLTNEINSLNARLGRQYLKQRELSLPDKPTDEQQKKFEGNQGDITAKIKEFRELIESKKLEKSSTASHIVFKELPEDHKYQTLHGGRKKMIDIIKMICYRGEIAMANIVAPSLSVYDKDTARTIVKNIFKTPADIYPNYEKKELRVRLHYMNNQKTNKAVRLLMGQLNQSNFVFPGTELELKYEFVSD
jgi:hypothetical protein